MRAAGNGHGDCGVIDQNIVIGPGHDPRAPIRRGRPVAIAAGAWCCLTLVLAAFAIAAPQFPQLTSRVVEGLGFTTGLFNVELFYDRENDAITLIEVNPRLSYQFADLYEHVDGSNTYDVLLDLTHGEQPRFRNGAGKFKVCASFVLRAFEGKRISAIPRAADVAAFSDRYPESTIEVYGKVGTNLRREIRATGSYRYAIINVAAQSYLDLFAIHQDAIDTLRFEFE